MQIWIPLTDLENEVSDLESEDENVNELNSNCTKYFERISTLHHYSIHKSSIRKKTDEKQIS